MAIRYNNSYITDFRYNGSTVTQVNYNGSKIWPVVMATSWVLVDRLTAEPQYYDYYDEWEFYSEEDISLYLNDEYPAENFIVGEIFCVYNYYEYFIYEAQ